METSEGRIKSKDTISGTTNNKDWIKITIQLEGDPFYYSAFDNQVPEAKDFNKGDVVKITSKQNGKYHNMTKIEKSDKVIPDTNHVQHASTAPKNPVQGEPERVGAPSEAHSSLLTDDTARRIALQNGGHVYAGLHGPSNDATPEESAKWVKEYVRLLYS